MRTYDAIPRSHSSKLLGVQYLRAVAAIMVAYLHLQTQIPSYQPLLGHHGFFDTDRLAAGVDIFFVISGFIMLVTSRHTSPTTFALRRIVRIVPLYWTMTLLLAAVAILNPQGVRTTVLTGTYLLKSLLFIPYANPGDAGQLAPLLIPGWTLNFEMYFYALFALVLFAPERHRVWLNGSVFAAILCVPRIVPHAADSAFVQFYANMRILEFWVGMLIGSFYLKGYLRLPRLVSWTLLLAGFAGLMVSNAAMSGLRSHWAIFGLNSLLPAGSIVLSVVALEQVGAVRQHALAALLGDASYSIYLTHVFSLHLARVMWRKLIVASSSGLESIAFAVATTFFALLFAAATYKLVEKPMLDLLHNATRTRRNRQTAAEVAPTAPAGS